MSSTKAETRPTAEPMEAELRLAGEPDVLKAVFTSPLMGNGKDAEERTADLESCYFDTPDRALRAKGLVLRVRANGKGYQQTLKADDDAQAALLKRGEWTTALDGDRPKLQALPKGARAKLPALAGENELTQAFKTKVKRRIRDVVVQGDNGSTGRIEAALDVGEIETETGSVPIAELELELVEGTPDALYRFALDLQDLGPLHLETRSKSTRAFDSLSGRPPAWITAETPKLDPGGTAGEAMAAIFESCFAQWLANQAAAIDGRDPEGVHQLRVALRRLRSALAVFRKIIPDDQLAWLREEARDTIQALGPARDWDVFRDDLLSPIIRARPDDPSLQALATRTQARIRGGYRRVRTHLTSSRYTRFVLRFGAWLEQRGWQAKAGTKLAERQAAPVAHFARSILKKRHRRVLAKGRDFGSLPTAERHELRILMKKLRYATEFFQPLFGKKAAKPFLKSVKAFQDDLGHLNDVAVAETLLEGLLSRPGKQDLKVAAGLVIGWHARGVTAIEPDLRRRWSAFAAEPAFWS